MPRFLIRIEYDGSGFVGWQRQDNGPSVQHCLEQAAAYLNNGQPVTIQGAGRTDAGVHASGQAAHLDIFPRTATAITAEKLPLALNARLPAVIRVLSARRVDDAFHARFDALERQYCYRILPRRVASALDRDRLWHYPCRGGIADIDLQAMQQAAAILVGHHDFTSFRAVACQAASALRTLDSLQIEQHGEELRLHARARSFLHHQIRNITGTLMLVGSGKWQPQNVAAALAARDRSAAGPTAPPQGLYLTAVRYALDSENPA